MNLDRRVAIKIGAPLKLFLLKINISRATFCEKSGTEPAQQKSSWIA
jgi:hypothetical protein